MFWCGVMCFRRRENNTFNSYLCIQDALKDSWFYTSYIHSNLDSMNLPENCLIGSVKFCITSLLQIFFLILLNGGITIVHMTVLLEYIFCYNTVAIRHKRAKFFDLKLASVPKYRYEAEANS